MRDIEESLKFYTDVLGMIVEELLQKMTPTKGSVITLKSPNSEQVLERTITRKIARSTRRTLTAKSSIT